MKCDALYPYYYYQKDTYDDLTWMHDDDDDVQWMVVEVVDGWYQEIEEVDTVLDKEDQMMKMMMHPDVVGGDDGMTRRHMECFHSK